jgi:hypothetical protein
MFLLEEEAGQVKESLTADGVGPKAGGDRVADAEFMSQLQGTSRFSKLR